MLLKFYVVHCLLSRCWAFLLQACLQSELSPLIFLLAVFGRGLGGNGDKATVMGGDGEKKLSSCSCL